MKKQFGGGAVADFFIDAATGGLVTDGDSEYVTSGAASGLQGEEAMRQAKTLNIVNKELKEHRDEVEMNKINLERGLERARESKLNLDWLKGGQVWQQQPFMQTKDRPGPEEPAEDEAEPSSSTAGIGPRRAALESSSSGAPKARTPIWAGSL